MTISGGRTKRLDIFCCITGFTSDFLSFIVVELIRFFHGSYTFVVAALGPMEHFPLYRGTIIPGATHLEQLPLATPEKELTN